VLVPLPETVAVRSKLVSTTFWLVAAVLTAGNRALPTAGVQRGAVHRNGPRIAGAVISTRLPGLLGVRAVEDHFFDERRTGSVAGAAPGCQTMSVSGKRGTSPTWAHTTATPGYAGTESGGGHHAIDPLQRNARVPARRVLRP